jgi:hypothetical protein
MNTDSARNDSTFRSRVLEAARAWPLRPHCRHAPDHRKPGRRKHRRLCLLLAPLLFGAHDCTPGRPL